MDDAASPPRPLDVQDAEPLHRLIQAAFAGQEGRLDPPQSALRETRHSLAAQIAAGGGICAERDGVLVGAVLWREQEGGLYLGRLAVAPSARGRGLARLLIAAAEAEARRRGLGCLRLSTRLALASNRALFGACGFVETVERAHEGYTHPTFVDMLKQLAPDQPAAGPAVP